MTTVTLMTMMMMQHDNENDDEDDTDSDNNSDDEDDDDSDNENDDEVDDSDDDADAGVDVQTLSTNIQPHQLDVDELSALVKNGQTPSKSTSSQLDDVNQRWTLILQRIIDSKVGIVIMICSLQTSEFSVHA